MGALMPDELATIKNIHGLESQPLGLDFLDAIQPLSAVSKEIAPYRLLGDL